MAKKQRKNRQAAAQPTESSSGPAVAPVAPGEPATGATGARTWPNAGYLAGIAIFALYLFFPYWQMLVPGETWDVFVWLGLAVVAIGWGWCAAPMAPLPRWQKPEWLTRADVVGLGAAFVLLQIVHAPYLKLAFCWQGDEEFHINRMSYFIANFGPDMASKRWLLVVLLLAAGAGAFALYKTKRLKTWWLLGLLAVIGYGALSLNAAVEGADPARNLTEYYLRRYPMLMVPLHALFALVLPGAEFSEWWNRQVSMVPFFLALAAIYTWVRREGIGWQQALALLAGLALIPMVFYQFHLLYIEPLMVLWYTGVIYLAWIYNDPDDVSQIYRVAAAAAVGGLIKETTLPFMVAAGAWCLWQLWRLKGGPSLAAKAVHLVRMGVIVLVPTLPYLYLRMKAGDRAYGMAYKNLWDPELYANWLFPVRDYVTIPILLLALAGVVLMLAKRRLHGVALLAILNTIGYFLFLSMDYLQNVSLVRFTLHFWPLLAGGLAGLVVVLNELSLADGRLKRGGPAIAAIVMIIVSGLIWRPPAPDKLGTWGGGTLVRSHEKHFPLNEMFTYVKGTIKPNTPIVIFGHPYTYYHMGFYQEKYQLHSNPPISVIQPDKDIAWMATVLPMKRPGDLIPQIHDAYLVWHFDDESKPQPENVPGVTKLREFRQGTRGYVVFEFHAPQRPTP